MNKIQREIRIAELRANAIRWQKIIEERSDYENQIKEVLNEKKQNL